jgi:alpha-galactosidase
VTSGAVTGSFFVGDNFSSSVEYGFPELSKTQASKMFTNEDINEIPRTCGTFMPVEGYKADVDGAESLFKYETDKYLYFAVINYKTLVYINDSITFERLGIDASNVGEIKELWSETEVTPTAKGVSYKVPGTDARIFRITKNGYSGINNITPSDNSIELRQCDGQINISSSNKLKNVSIYCIDGKIISDARCSSYSLSIPTSSFKQGLYIVKAKTDNNIEKTLKISVK